MTHTSAPADATPAVTSERADNPDSAMWCPFCEGTAQVRYCRNGDFWEVRCDEPECWAAGPQRPSREDALAAWDRHAQSGDTLLGAAVRGLLDREGLACIAIPYEESGVRISGTVTAVCGEALEAAVAALRELLDGGSREGADDVLR